MVSINYKVLPIKPEETYDWLLNKHYAHRIPSISWAFGLYKGDSLLGIITYGTPASSPLLKGVCGAKYQNIVIELNRLCINDTCFKNAGSFLIGHSLKMLPAPKIIISYADTSQGHIGYVYQATNWIYTGLSAKRTDWKIKGKEHLHGQTIADEFRGREHRAELMRKKYGDNFYLKERSRKHRYIYFIGSRIEKKNMLKALHYPILPYPKGDNQRYDASYQPQTQGILF